MFLHHAAQRGRGILCLRFRGDDLPDNELPVTGTQPQPHPRAEVLQAGRGILSSGVRTSPGETEQVNQTDSAVKVRPWCLRQKAQGPLKSKHKDTQNYTLQNSQT